ncbi:MAG: hypothetical protein AAF487_07085 [Bacteroidota bacterium]
MKSTISLFLLCSILLCSCTNFENTDSGKEGTEKISSTYSMEKNSIDEVYLDKLESSDLIITEPISTQKSTDKTPRLIESVKEKSIIHQEERNLNSGQIELKSLAALDVRGDDRDIKESIDQKITYQKFLDPILKDATETISFNPQVNNNFVLKKGTKIHIPANSISDAKGELFLGVAELNAIEIISLKDAILTGSTTNYGNEILASRGMLDIQCSDEKGNELFIRSGSQIGVTVPQMKEPIEGTSIFKARETNNRIDWIMDNSQDATFDTLINYTRIAWSKLNEDQLRKNERAKEIRILALKGNGKNKSSIKRKLKRCRKYVHRKHRKNREDPRKSYPRHSKYLKINERMILGDAKFAWQIDPISRSQNLRSGYYTYGVKSFGRYNIDFIYKINKPKVELYVRDSGEHKINLLFQKQKVLLAGMQEEESVQFSYIPTDQEITFISTKAVDEDKVEFGYLKTNSSLKNFEIKNYQVYNRDEYLIKLEEVTHIKDDLSSR